MEGSANTKKWPQGDNILTCEEDYHEDSSPWYINVFSDPERRVHKLVSTYGGMVVFRGATKLASIVAVPAISSNSLSKRWIDNRQNLRTRFADQNPDAETLISRWKTDEMRMVAHQKRVYLKE